MRLFAIVFLVMLIGMDIINYCAIPPCKSRDPLNPIPCTVTWCVGP